MAASVDIKTLLLALVQLKGSDLHCKVGVPPRVRIDGALRSLQYPDLQPQDTEALLSQLLSDDERAEFMAAHEADFAYSVVGVGRFRVNAYRSKGTTGLVMRHVAATPPAIESLGLPDIVTTLSGEPRGLILVTGPTGSGKTTTLGAMVDLLNRTRPLNIVTVEDPIEIVHTDKRSNVIQREVHHDTDDFASAMRAAMRQDPDVILVGEMRDVETVRAALSAAETGHLVMSTLHTIDAQETVNRVIDFFPPHEQAQVRHALSQSLRGIISQRLVPRHGGSGRVVAMEVLVNNGRTAEAINDPTDAPDLLQLIKEGGFVGMQTFDQHLLQLVLAGHVDIETALDVSTQPQDLRLELRQAGVAA